MKSYSKIEFYGQKQLKLPTPPGIVIGGDVELPQRFLVRRLSHPAVVGVKPNESLVPRQFRQRGARSLHREPAQQFDLTGVERLKKCLKIMENDC